MLLLRGRRMARQRAALLPLIAAVLLCVIPVSSSVPGKARHNVELDEDIDYFRSILEKQQVTDIKPPKKQHNHDAALTSQTDAHKSKLNNQALVLDEALRATAAAPLPTVSTLPSTPTPELIATVAAGRSGPKAGPATRKDSIIIIMISLCVAVGTIAVILATICYIKFQKESRLAEKVDYPAYGGTGTAVVTTNGATTGDKTLAQSAQMYHYQHQKQQMLSVGNHKPEQKSLDTEVTSDEEDVGGDFTVYECPGLAPTGEMEVKNPLFDDSNLSVPANHK
ncbi:neural proliferation differentiation and control protein 1-like [Antennarius striatus]|uniref:neural proliferation differentiation and control protein 1-like n=1 Tax=Antennarius striatus TaxID=241820 RepID=UPI0035AFB674